MNTPHKIWLNLQGPGKLPRNCAWFFNQQNWISGEPHVRKKPRNAFLGVHKKSMQNILKRGRRAGGNAPYVASPFDFDRANDQNS
jgi:hypothetical protein